MAAWKQDLLDRLAANPVAGYFVEQSPASEVVALSALALVSHGREDKAAVAARWLADQQAEDGSLGTRMDLSVPRWPASLAALAWQSMAKKSGHSAYESNIASAINWLLSVKGTTLPSGGASAHDTTLAGWPWVEGTHSWLEPTAWAVLALRAAGMAEHSRTQEAIRVLLDRTLAGGGCNYGNTIVLGQMLRPHVQPTGLAMLALAGLGHADARIARSLDYLAAEIRPRQGTTSLCFATLGLAAHNRLPQDWQRHLQAAAKRTLARDASPYKLALLALAVTGADCALIRHKTSLSENT
jgi:hypothetical protein